MHETGESSALADAVPGFGNAEQCGADGHCYQFAPEDRSTERLAPANWEDHELTDQADFFKALTSGDFPPLR